MIWTEFAPTGDGIAAALLALRALGGADLADARPMRAPAPGAQQRRGRRPRRGRRAAELWAAVERENEALEGRGRVLVRASGTEPLAAGDGRGARAEEECRRGLRAVRSRSSKPQLGQVANRTCAVRTRTTLSRLLMCGIVGYVGRRPCRDLLIAGLEKLEYRGYDSAGISLLADGEIDDRARGRQPRQPARGRRARRRARR